MFRKSILKASSKQKNNLHVSNGDAARAQGKWQEARLHYASHLDVYPEDGAIWVQLGHAEKESGRLKEAERAYQRAADLRHNEADTYLQLGHLMKISGDVPQAIDYYLRSISFDAGTGDAAGELIALGVPSRKIRESLRGSIGDEAEQVSAKYCFDVSDLIQYFQNARIATGIQRVQINIITSLINRGGPGQDISVISYSPAAGSWVQIPNDHFIKLIELASENSDTSDATWQAGLKRLRQMLSIAPPVEFAQGAILINLGTSWWLKNYFLSVRNAKRAYGIRYVPYVHDCIPALMPEHCVKELTRDFLNWIRNAFAHTDFYLCNSQWTRSDLVNVGENLTGERIPNTAVIPLDGDSRTSASTGLSAKQDANVLRKYNLRKEQYVVFVSTIESRKNHLRLFETWLRLIRELGGERVPKLICIGNKGWKVDATLQMLESSKELESHVTIAHGISDADLAALYRNCKFSVYPSLYEGWGLPVTEALCYGKPVASSNASSLPEAGGNHAIYFDPQNSGEMYSKIEELITSRSAFAHAQELARSYRPRAWQDIADQLIKTLSNAFPDETPETNSVVISAAQAAVPVLGQIYSFKEDTGLQLRERIPSADRFRVGDGWSTIDDFGTWMSSSTSSISLGDPGGDKHSCSLYLLVVGLPQQSGKSIVYRAFTQTGEIVTEPVKAGEKSLLKIELKKGDWVNGEAVIDIKTNESESLLHSSGGRDSRTVFGGFAMMMVAEKGNVESRIEFLEKALFG